MLVNQLNYDWKSPDSKYLAEIGRKSGLDG